MKSIKEQVEYLRDFVVDEKNALFDRLIQERTDYVTVVLEDLFQSHNQSAVMRSADCYGIQHVHLIENRNSYDMTSTVSQGARDWLSIHRHKELENNTQATQRSTVEGRRLSYPGYDSPCQRYFCRRYRFGKRENGFFLRDRINRFVRFGYRTGRRICKNTDVWVYRKSERECLCGYYDVQCYPSFARERYRLAFIRSGEG